MIKKKVGLLAAALSLFAFAAQADIVSGGNVKLGINDYGQLNVPGAVASVSGETRVGARWIAPGGGEYEVTSHGCECEGWGVAAGGVSGYANNAIDGVVNLGLVSAVGDGTNFTSVTTMGDLQITHVFSPSAATANLYEVAVTITNMGAATATDVEYRRVMDWDTDPTPFNEYVSNNTGTSANLLESSNDGFSSGDPLSSICGNFGIASCTQGDFTDLGPQDHGANFDFGFGDLAAGDSIEFSIFYGGAENTAAALAAIGAVSAEVYSFGRSGFDANDDGFHDDTGALTPTFIFAFSGVGGDPIPAPEPGTLLLLGGGLLGMGIARRRRRV